MQFKNSFLLTLLCIATYHISIAQTGTIVNDSVTSNILKETKHFSVYLPEGYYTDSLQQNTYPVIYLLHGLGGKPIDWDTYGNLNVQVSQAIQDSIMPKTIIIMPDGEATYYMNNINKEYEYEDFFYKEFIPFVENKYQCKTDKTNRGVAGLSMGGFGTLLYAFHHPDMFVAASALSPAVRTDKEIIELTDKAFEIRYKTAFGSPKTPADRINDFYNHNSILYLAEHMQEQQKGSVKLYIDCGDDDFLDKGNSTLHILLRDKKIPHEYRVRNGGHTWNYWQSGLIDALVFITNNFNE